MGNKIEVHKVKQFVTEISETMEISEQFLKSEFRNLFDLIGIEIKSNIEVTNTLKETIGNLNEICTVNFTNNLINYLNMLISENKINSQLGNKNKNDLKLSLDILLIIIESIYEKQKNLRDILIFSIDSITEKNEDETTNIIHNIFPFNVLKICIDLFSNQEIFITNNFAKTENEHFEITSTLSKIIFNIIYFQKNNELLAKSYIEYFDSFKFFFYSTIVMPKEKVDKFILTLFFTFILNFNTMTKNINYATKPEIENHTLINFYLLLWFCFDINKFFFTDIKEIFNNDVNEIYFENEFNEKIFKFIGKYLTSESCLGGKNNIIEIIKNYNKMYSDLIMDVVLYNTNIFKDFILNFFSNYEKLSMNFKFALKFFLIYIFENNNDIIEMICLQKDFLKMIMKKLKFNDFFDLVIINKLTTCKNFYIMIKNIDFASDNNLNLNLDSEISQFNIQSICEKSLESILLNRKENLKLDPISYLLFLTVYNLSCYLTEINSAIYLKLGEFLTYFYDIEITHENRIDNIIIIKLYLEIILNFLRNLEFPANLVLVLLKFNEQINKIHDKYEYFYNCNLENDGKHIQSWKAYYSLYEVLQNILNKFKITIEEEGANIKFTQNSELLKIINKISIDKICNIDDHRFKQNKVFGTDTEKFIILIINSFDNLNSKVFNK